MIPLIRVALRFNMATNDGVEDKDDVAQQGRDDPENQTNSQMALFSMRTLRSCSILMQNIASIR